MAKTKGGGAFKPAKGERIGVGDKVQVCFENGKGGHEWWTGEVISRKSDKSGKWWLFFPGDGEKGYFDESNIEVITKAPKPPVLSSIPGPSSSSHSSSEIDLDSLSRAELQSLAKKHGVKANQTSPVIIAALRIIPASAPKHSGASRHAAAPPLPSPASPNADLEDMTYSRLRDLANKMDCKRCALPRRRWSDKDPGQKSEESASRALIAAIAKARASVVRSSQPAQDVEHEDEDEDEGEDEDEDEDEVVEEDEGSPVAAAPARRASGGRATRARLSASTCASGVSAEGSVKEPS
ncbi:hypothetical protein T484DRAFT_1656698, partial [Baffinella frigidus]